MIATSMTARGWTIAAEVALIAVALWLAYRSSPARGRRRTGGAGHL